MELPPRLVLELLNSDQLISEEKFIWESLIHWSSWSEFSLTEELLLNSVRYGLLDKEYYRQFVLPVLLSAGVVEIVQKSLDQDTHPYHQTRSPPFLVLTIGGWTSGPDSTISVYDPSANRWKEVPTQLPSMAYASSVLVESQIYLCGGNRVPTFGTRELLKLCPNTLEVRRLSSMRQGRNYLATVVCGGYIYAIGGHNGDERLRTVERYEIEKNQWSWVRPMSSKRSDAGAAVIGGRIYVVGGFDGTTPTNTMEMFCPSLGIWTILPSMRIPRSGVRSIAVDGKLYVVGGWDGNQRLSSCEVYNPETGRWKDLPSMKIPRSNHSLVATPDGKLIAVGGYQGYDTTNSVEVFDVRGGEWAVVEGLPRKRSAMTSVLIMFNKLDAEEREYMRWSTHDIKQDFEEHIDDDLSTDDDDSDDEGFSSESE